ncbi:hypothetical protein ZYGR_0H01960 [Zygosaccharomyces rouxii]|uniref:ZYRO0B08536p n=2 Tax=Zygosaccharomyces rouxii TaxID=4956 RepID=C5DRH7_ZYGRC|nr:uncharacterized protein ZYRO0B08536g [Zygosaccharomyces rouxii]KAH9200074.1 TATA element modulatory factor 1 TATA binding-domain-containing protein [Zygosaccharomyces rouxii]GAV47355.1 hypothetical protein ZYGR_0H01960 [Zygosaccharomyces rouxii]CAR26388.1 ZYRO0B08536p [Zygosaccharomyces rouxii]
MTDTSKKLTLEERLSLAAKKSKKKNKKSPSPAAIVPTEVEQTTEKTEKSDKAEIDEKVNEKSDEKDDKVSNAATASAPQLTASSENNLVPEQEDSEGNNLEEENNWKRQIQLLNSLKDKEPWSQWLTKATQFSNVDDFLKTFEPALRSIYEELQNYKKQEDVANESTTDKEKDELIAQLRYEGEKLAATELRQNNAIKSLRKKLAGMENDIKVTQEELFKKISSYEQLFDSHEDLQTQLQNCEVIIKNLRQDNAQLKDSESQLENKKEEVESLRSTLEMEHQKFEQREKDMIIEIDTLKSSSQEQVTQLETSLEQLRIKLDSSSKKDQKEPVPNYKENEEILRKELESLKFSSSQLENSLTGKISDLETKLNQLQQSSSQLEGQLQSVRQLNESLEIRLSDESKNREQNAVKLQELQRENEKLRNSLQDSIEDYNLLQRKYEIRQTHLESNVESNLVPTEKESKPSQSLDVPHNQKDGTVPPSPAEEDWMYPPNVSQISSMGPPMDFESSSLQKEVDEISDRPPIEDDKLSINGMDIPEEAAAMGSHVHELHSTSRQTNSMNYRRRSTQVDSTGQMNAHMISKLGAEIRRYEAELVSLQNSCERLQKEKMEASNEILKLLEDNERVQVLSKEKDELTRKLEETQSKLETSLQILGEKTERVEELENDVADLKEMMQQQVQQMADMQERLR